MEQQCETPERVVVIDGKPYRLRRRFVKLGSFVRVDPSHDGTRLSVETFEPILQSPAE